MTLMGEKMKSPQKNLSQFHLNHKSHTTQGPKPDSTAKGLTTNFWAMQQSSIDEKNHKVILTLKHNYWLFKTTNKQLHVWHLITKTEGGNWIPMRVTTKTFNTWKVLFLRQDYTYRHLLPSILRHPNLQIRKQNQRARLWFFQEYH
jgi:hypothetical protein